MQTATVKEKKHSSVSSSDFLADISATGQNRNLQNDGIKQYGIRKCLDR